ncbi:MAG: cytochrome c biogenesis heme-transporting ATPase CcmA [Pyrinomonadaceae bacterium]
MLEANNLECMRGDRRLFSNLNFSVGPGTCLQLTGPNGSGKTSLLRIICRLLTPVQGEIRWRGANIRSLGEEFFEAVTYIGHRNGLKEELSSLENLRVAIGMAGIKASREDCNNALREMGLARREDLPVRLLSEGQRRRSAMARLLISKSALWLLDEIFTSLDSSAVASVTTLIEAHLSQGGIAIIATHQQLDLSAGLVQRLDLAS